MPFFPKDQEAKFKKGNLMADVGIRLKDEEPEELKTTHVPADDECYTDDVSIPCREALSPSSATAESDLSSVIMK